MLVVTSFSVFPTRQERFSVSVFAVIFKGFVPTTIILRFMKCSAIVNILQQNSLYHSILWAIYKSGNSNEEKKSNMKIFFWFALKWSFYCKIVNYWQKTILSEFKGTYFIRYKGPGNVKKMIEYFDFDTLYKIQPANDMHMWVEFDLKFILIYGAKFQWKSKEFTSRIRSSSVNRAPYMSFNPFYSFGIEKKP